MRLMRSSFSSVLDQPPFNQWGIEKVAVERPQHQPRPSTVEGNREDSTTTRPPRSVRYCGRVVVDRYLLPPYTPRKALDGKSFPFHDACTYVFDLVVAGLNNEDGSSGGDTKRNPLVESSAGNCNDGFASEDRLSPPPASSLQPVTEDLIKRIRERCICGIKQPTATSSRVKKRRKR